MKIASPPEPSDLPIELRLLAACCAHPVSPDTRERVDRLAKRIDDWEKVSFAARRHQVQGFVQDRLAKNGAVPIEVRRGWAKEARQRAAFNLKQAAMTGRLHALLNRHSIPNLVIKGLPLAADLYSSLTIKRSADIDLLIDPVDAVEAVQLLADNGFVAVATGESLSPRQTQTVVRHFKEITLRGEGNILVDLHWRLVEHPDLLKGIEPFANAREVSIDNLGSIAVLGEADEFAYLCVHGALSDWSRLKWLADVNAMLARWNEDKIVALYEYARGLGAGPSVLQALVLRALLWDAPVPNALETDLSHLGGARLVEHPLARMAMPYKPASSRDALGRIAAQTRVRSALFGSSWSAACDLSSHLRALPDVLALPLPPALAWLYVPLRPLMWLQRKVLQ